MTPVKSPPKRPVPDKRKPAKAGKAEPRSVRNLPAIIEQGFESMMAAAAPSSTFTGGLPVVDKAHLVGLPFVIVGWGWHPSDLKGASQFVSVTAITESGEAIVFNDGSKGVAAQLRAIEGKAPAGLELRYDANGMTVVDFMLGCRRGLRLSEYEGPAGPAKTYYIS